MIYATHFQMSQPKKNFFILKIKYIHTAKCWYYFLIYAEVGIWMFAVLSFPLFWMLEIHSKKLGRKIGIFSTWSSKRIYSHIYIFFLNLFLHMAWKKEIQLYFSHRIISFPNTISPVKCNDTSIIHQVPI